MLDARNVYRKVTRKIYDFSPEQLANLTAIIWLYRGQNQRFIDLVFDHLNTALTAAYTCFRANDGETDSEPLAEFSAAYQDLRHRMQPFLDTLSDNADVAHREALADYRDPANDPTEPIAGFERAIADTQQHADSIAADMPGATNFHDHSLKPLAKQSRSLIHAIEHACKIAGRMLDLCEKELAAKEHPRWNNRDITKARKQLDAARHAAVEHLKQVRYFQRHAAWLIERFPQAEFVAVPGLCKAVSLTDIAAADWSLTPGRYVGVAPQEVDEDFDFEQAMREIHLELVDLNQESFDLAAKIQQSFQELV